MNNNLYISRPPLQVNNEKILVYLKGQEIEKYNFEPFILSTVYSDYNTDNFYIVDEEVKNNVLNYGEEFDISSAAMAIIKIPYTIGNKNDKHYIFHPFWKNGEQGEIISGEGKIMIDGPIWRVDEHGFNRTYYKFISDDTELNPNDYIETVYNASGELGDDVHDIYSIDFNKMELGQMFFIVQENMSSSYFVNKLIIKIK